MATLTISISDSLLEAFQQKYPPESREEALTGALIDLVQDDPCSPEAYAEDERRYQEAVTNNSFISHDDVMARLEQQLDEARTRRSAKA